MLRPANAPPLPNDTFGHALTKITSYWLKSLTFSVNSIVGAESVVSRSIPADVVAVGVPCRVMREITEADKYRYSLHQGN